MLGCEELGQQESFFLQKWSIIYLRFSPVTQYSNQLATQLIAKGLLGLKLDLKRISHSWESLRLEKTLLRLYWPFDTWYHTLLPTTKTYYHKKLGNISKCSLADWQFVLQGALSLWEQSTKLTTPHEESLCTHSPSPWISRQQPL